MNQPVLPVRIAIEILRAHGCNTIPTSSQATALANGVADMCKEHTMHSFPNWERAEQSRPCRGKCGPTVSPFWTGWESHLPRKCNFFWAHQTKPRWSHGWSAGEHAGPLDTVPTPDLLTWRLQRLRTWKTQDAPVQYPQTYRYSIQMCSTSPTCDGMGFDACDDDSLERAPYQASIPTSNFHKSRALAGGSSRHDDHAADGDEPHGGPEVGCITGFVSLGDDAIQSMAATLPIAQQDQMPLAAKKRVRSGQGGAWRNFAAQQR